MRMSRVMAALTAVMLGSLPVGRLYAADTDTDPLASGPKALVITSSVAPAQRPQLRKIIATAGVRQFQRWRAEGVLDSYQLFFNRNVETDGWDLITLVTFARYADVVRWNELEKTHPAGLPIEAARLLRTVHTSPVDLVRNGSVPKTGHGKPVFALIPYTYNPDTPVYVSYLDTYVIPQVKGWQQEGVLASYSIYIARYQTDRPWNALFVLEYDDEESLGRRDPVMAKVRARLRESNPEWKTASEHKQDIRHEHAIVLTEEILPE